MTNREILLLYLSKKRLKSRVLKYEQYLKSIGDMHPNYTIESMSVLRAWIYEGATENNKFPELTLETCAQFNSEFIVIRRLITGGLHPELVLHHTRPAVLSETENALRAVENRAYLGSITSLFTRSSGKKKKQKRKRMF